MTENKELVNQKEIERKITKSHPEISQLLADKQVKKVHERESKGANIYKDENGDISKINFWEKKYWEIELHKNQQKIQEIPPSEKKTQSLEENPKSVESENPIKANQEEEISPQKSEKAIEIPVNLGVENNSDTNDGGENISSSND